MKEEIKSLLELGTWEYVDACDVPRDRNVTKSKWFYTIKYHRDGSEMHRNFCIPLQCQ